MFHCDCCGKTSQPREPMVRKVVETRPKVYDNGHGIAVGRGAEVVREERWCSACAKGGRS